MIRFFARFLPLYFDFLDLGEKRSVSAFLDALFDLPTITLQKDFDRISVTVADRTGQTGRGRAPMHIEAETDILNLTVDLDVGPRQSGSLLGHLTAF